MIITFNVKWTCHQCDRQGKFSVSEAWTLARALKKADKHYWLLALAGAEAIKRLKTADRCEKEAGGG
jgi:hypothetical protein